MKRELLCAPCGAGVNLPKYPGEGWKLLFGVVLKPYRCDDCNTAVKAADLGAALSIYRDGGYFAWESEHLKDPRPWTTRGKVIPPDPETLLKRFFAWLLDPSLDEQIQDRGPHD